jgi:hypothetical protein
MATFRVQNISGTKLAVPPPLTATLEPGASADLEAHSADTAAIKDLIDRQKIRVTPINSGAPSDDVEGATLGRLGGETTTTIGTIADPVVIGSGETMTFAHGLGGKASKIDVYDSDGANFTANADIAVAQADADTIAVTSTAGGSFVVECSFPAGVDNALAGDLAQDDANVTVA